MNKSDQLTAFHWNTWFLIAFISRFLKSKFSPDETIWHYSAVCCCWGPETSYLHIPTVCVFFSKTMPNFIIQQRDTKKTSRSTRHFAATFQACGSATLAVLEFESWKGTVCDIKYYEVSYMRLKCFSCDRAPPLCRGKDVTMSNLDDQMLFSSCVVSNKLMVLYIMLTMIKDHPLALLTSKDQC